MKDSSPGSESVRSGEANRFESIMPPATQNSTAGVCSKERQREGEHTTIAFTVKESMDEQIN